MLDMRFPGQWFQLETGLHYNWHRHYDPTLGRYLQPDPLEMDDVRRAPGGGSIQLTSAPILFSLITAPISENMKLGFDPSSLRSRVLLANGPGIYDYSGDNPLSGSDSSGLNTAGGLTGAIRGAEIAGGFGIETGPLDVAVTAIGGAIGGVIGDWLTGPDVSYIKIPGYLPADLGAEKWGVACGLGKKQGRRIFHKLKQDTTGSSAPDDYLVNPDTGDVVDPQGESVGNLNDENSDRE